MRNDELSMKQIWRDSRWGPLLRCAKTQEERDYFCDEAEREYRQNRYLQSHPGSIPVTIIVFP